jgi:hypothetical protein
MHTPNVKTSTETKAGITHTDSRHTTNHKPELASPGTDVLGAARLTGGAHPVRETAPATLATSNRGLITRRKGPFT